MTRIARLLQSCRRSEIAIGIFQGALVSAALLAVVELSGLDLLSGVAKPSLRTPDRASTTPVVADARRRVASFGDEPASSAAIQVANWALASGDASGSDFFLIDKKNAKLFAFDKDGILLGAAPVLLGAAIGDDTLTGVGDKEVADVLPEERTTPAGRFVAERGHDTRGDDVVWVDYAAGISMHRVLTANPSEHRLERLESPTIDDNRISFGCINLPAVFYETHVKPAFAAHRAVVYILPEVKSLTEVFGSRGPPIADPVSSVASRDTPQLTRNYIERLLR